jgi:hypothetical protein
MLFHPAHHQQPYATQHMGPVGNDGSTKINQLMYGTISNLIRWLPDRYVLQNKTEN